MRYIRTTNNQIEFIEANDEGKILNSIGLQLGEVYFQIKNKKVAFYLNDSEKPFDNFIWSMNLPITIDEETYEDEDEVSAVLHNIMNDRFQEQLDELRETISEEIGRAQAAEEALGEEIDDERDRAISAETHLQSEVTELSGLVATFDERITDCEDAISALTDDLADEVTRSTAKDAEHDALISGLTNSLNNEIQRAISAETEIANDLDQEIADRIADVDAEETRALAAESALTDALNDEITRSTAKDAEHDAEISGLTTSLQNEINRAVGAENSLRDDLNDEVSARTSADSAMVQRITALEVGKADKSDVYTKAESDNKYATKEYVSGNTYTKAEIATMMAEKADKLNAVSTALYNSQNKTIDLKNIYGNVVASIDARDFIKDGMVNNAYIENNNLVITFNTDAGLEDIVVPLTDIFDPSNYYTKAETDEAIADAIDDIDLSNYYTKSEVDASQTAQDNKINAISGDVQTLSGKVDTISGDVITLGGNVQTLSGEVQTISGDVQTISEKVDDMKTYVGGRGITIASGETADTISFNLPISAGTGSDSIIEGYRTQAKGSYSHAEGYMSQTDTYSSYSHAEGYSSTTVGDYSHAEGMQTKTTGDFSHAEGVKTESKSISSHAEGKYTTAATPYSFVCGLNGLTSGNTEVVEDTNTIFAIGNGLDDTHKTTRIHNALEVKLNGDIYISSGGTRTSPMIKLQDHLGGGGGGVTPTEVQTMIDNSLVGYQEELSAGTNVQINNNVISATDTKYTAGDGISISNQNVISTVTKFWCGTQAQYDAITIKDPNTVYMIHE